MSGPLPADPARPTWFRPLPLGLGLTVAAAAALFPLIGPAYRPWNFAAFGAIGLFVAARVGLFPALLLALGSKLGFDYLNYQQHGSDPLYLPSTVVYGCLALYAVFGYAFLRKTESPLKIAGTAVLGGVPFFLVTNFVEWQNKVNRYSEGIEGLFQSYWMALPFHRGTVLSDLAFTGLLFGLHAALSRAFFPAERVVPRPAVVAEPVRAEDYS
jgi:hypothetical protein